MTCKDCRHSTVVYKTLIRAMDCSKKRPEFKRPDLPAERCPKFQERDGNWFREEP